jgi:hypothetical protein
MTIDSKQEQVAVHASRLFPSTSAWLRPSDSISAAAFSQIPGYASWPNTLDCGRATADASRPASPISTSPSTIRFATSMRSSPHPLFSPRPCECDRHHRADGYA